MSAAHPSLFVALAMAAKPGAKFRAMFPPHTLRDRIRNAFITGGGCLDNCYEAAERVFRAFLNVPPADILKIIAKTAIIFNPPIVTDLMRDVQEFGPVVDEQIRLAGFAPLNDPRVNERNRRYFALEMMESRIVRAFIRSLCNDNLSPTSVVWLHDGILIAPCPSTNVIQEKWHAATAAATGHHIAVQIRINALAPKRTALLEEIASMPCVPGRTGRKRRAIVDPLNEFIAAPLDDMHLIQCNLNSFYARRGL